MVEESTRTCVVCGTEFAKTDKRKIYCKPSCRQEAHRQRHELPKPEFLRSATVPPESRRKGTKTVNPAYTAKVQEIARLESQLSLLRFNRERIKMDEVKIIKQDPILLATLSTAALAAGAVVGLVLMGYLATDKLKDKDKHDNTRLLAFFLGLGLAAFLAIATHAATADRAKQRKIDRISQLKAESDRLELEIQSVESLLTVHRAELLSLSATSTQQEPESAGASSLTDEPSIPGVITATDLRAMHFDLLAIDQQYSRLFGQPQRGFAMAVSGGAGQGKSSFVAQLAYDLASRNGEGIYFLAEEGFSRSAQAKVQAFTSDCLLLSHYKTLASVSQELQRRFYSVAVLDSVQQMGISAVELAALRAEHPQTSFIYILHARKDGQFKGDNRFAHDADIQLRVEAYQPLMEKTRFLPTTT